MSLGASDRGLLKIVRSLLSHQTIRTVCMYMCLRKSDSTGSSARDRLWGCLATTWKQSSGHCSILVFVSRFQMHSCWECAADLSLEGREPDGFAVLMPPHWAGGAGVDNTQPVWLLAL